MPKLLQISIEVNSGSVGRIAEQIGDVAMQQGWESHITYARNFNPSKSKVIKIGTKWDVYLHGLETRIFDNHGFGSRLATFNLLSKIKSLKPDIIHLHHLHGYFINIEILFKFLKDFNVPVIWTFHDCWSFTGHCAYFDFVGCDKWKSLCYDCEQKKEYPASFFFDRSTKNFLEKKEIFNSLSNLTIVPVSYWLSNKVGESFLSNVPRKVIQNGIDLSLFYPRLNLDLFKSKYLIKDKFIILGVASTWEKRKGLSEFLKLFKLLDSNLYSIVLVGVSKSQIKNLPSEIIGVERTESIDELANFYSVADVFVNPTFEDTFPTTNLEALACGTPIITYNTGGSIESVNDDTGFVVEKNDISGLINAIYTVQKKGKMWFYDNCRKSAIENFNNMDKFNDYLNLYKELLSRQFDESK